MIKDLIVNLAVGAERDRARDYALTIAEAFDAHLSMAILLYIMLPPSTVVTLVFGAVLGLFWLSTVPPTSGLIVVMFGTRWLATLFGLAFFRVGGFLGVWLGGLLFERTGSYDVVWWLAILFGVLSAVINLPIVEKPIVRSAFAPA